MNQRIQELAEQSTKKLHGFSYRFGHTTETIFDHEQFAELIVRECIDAAQEAQADFYVVYNIKSRFGVEP
jgi:hypothetical protein